MCQFCIFRFGGACLLLNFHSFDSVSGHRESFIPGKSVTFVNNRVPWIYSNKRPGRLPHIISRLCAYLIFSIFCKYWKLFLTKIHNKKRVDVPKKAQSSGIVLLLCTSVFMGVGGMSVYSIEAGLLLNFPYLRVDAYSSWAIVRGWALNEINKIFRQKVDCTCRTKINK